MYKEIPVSLVSADKEYDFRIYLKINNTYRLFAGKGAWLTKEHINILKTKGTHIFVLEQDWEIARRQLYQNRGRVIACSDHEARIKAERIYNSAMDSIKDAYHGLLPRTIADVEKNADELVKIILSDDNVIETLKLMATTDHFTYQHSVRVGIYATGLLLKLMKEKLSKNQIKKLSTGFFLHDIGMTRIPMQILEKPESLSNFEWKLIRMHPIWGHESLMKTEYLNIEATNIIMLHHERHDGRGYPNKTKGDDIPIYVRICSIADSFESLTATRPYRKPYEPFEALRIMYQEMSQDFDPELFRAFVKLLGPNA
jgi:HD-GYP domain-containing protein (c-di-GMP phosphodiesterase class II)